MKFLLFVPSRSRSTPARRASCVLPLAALALALGAPAPASAQTTYAADQLVESVGVNLHLHHDDTLYRDNFPLIKSRLLELGVRRVRDGLVDTEWVDYYRRHSELGAAGIRGTFIVTPGMPDAVLQNYPSRVAPAFEAYEAPNEYDWSGNSAWVTTLRATLVQLRALKLIPALAGYPVIGPALTSPAAYAALGDVSPFIDAGNMHNYFAGRHPGTSGWGADGYGSIDWNLGTVRPFIGGKPVISTETGWWDDPAVRDFAPPDIVGRYMPRMLLEQFRKGIARTYVYELVDYPKGGAQLWSGYGLLTRDGARKPAYFAMSGLLTLLADPGPAFSVHPISYTVDGAGADVRHMMFQKRDGRYFLAIWIERSGWDVNARQRLAVPTQTVTVTVPPSVRASHAHVWQQDGRVLRTTMAATNAFSFTISDRLSIIELTPPASSPLAPANLRVAPRF